MRPSERDLWRDVDDLAVTTPDDLTVTTEVVELTESEPDPVEAPEDATILETDSDVVAVWAVE